MFPELAGEDRYELDRSHWPVGSVWALEGTKGGETREWGAPPDIRNFWDIETEAQKRTLAFIDRAVEAKAPFFVAYHPILAAFFPDPRSTKKLTANKNMLAEALVELDAFAALRTRFDQLAGWPLGESSRFLPSLRGVVDQASASSKICTVRITDNPAEAEIKPGYTLAIYRDGIYKGEALITEVQGEMVFCTITSLKDGASVSAGDAAATNPAGM